MTPSGPLSARPRARLEASEARGGSAPRVPAGERHPHPQTVGMSFVERALPGGMHRRLLEGWQRFRRGFQQLVLTFQALRGDALAWKRYLRVCTVQALVTAALASVFVSTARH